MPYPLSPGLERLLHGWLGHSLIPCRVGVSEGLLPPGPSDFPFLLKPPLYQAQPCPHGPWPIWSPLEARPALSACLPPDTSPRVLGFPRAHVGLRGNKSFPAAVTSLMGAHLSSARPSPLSVQVGDVVVSPPFSCWPTLSFPKLLPSSQPAESRGSWAKPYSLNGAPGLQAASPRSGSFPAD